MVNHIIARRYAKAYYSVMQDAKNADAAADDMDYLQRNIRLSDHLRALIEQASFNDMDVLRVMDVLFQDRITSSTLRYIHFLGHKRRLDLLLSICDEFIALYHDDCGIQPVVLDTSIELSDEVQMKLAQKLVDVLKVRQVKLAVRMNTRLIGGYIVRINDTVIDFSLKNALLRFKKNTIDG